MNVPRYHGKAAYFLRSTIVHSSAPSSSKYLADFQTAIRHHGMLIRLFLMKPHMRHPALAYVAQRSL